MKKILYVFCAFAASFVIFSCVDEHNLDNLVPTPGQEVVFAGSIGHSADTKTLYGSDNSSSIKMKWVNGDKIKIFGTACAGDFNEAEYEVSVEGSENVPNQDDETKYNGSISKTGDVGLRWSDDPEVKASDFVAIYPSRNASFSLYNGTVTATTSISQNQNYVFNDQVTVKSIDGKDVEVWEGTHYGNDINSPSMENAIMFARSSNVPSGQVVSLDFHPATTVLRFRFMGFDESVVSGTKEIIVQSVTITAPYTIAGDFDLTIPVDEDKVTAEPTSSNNTNSITIVTRKKSGAYLKLTNKQAAEFNVFTVPKAGYVMSKDKLWTITIQIQGREPLVYTMTPANNAVYTLAPRKIHKIKIPAMHTITDVTFNPGSWVEQIPGNVYLSELSFPGAWYCMDDAYQGSIGLESDTKTYVPRDKAGEDGLYYSVTTNQANGIDDGLEHMFYNGIRSFNIDCRVSRDEFSQSGFLGTPPAAWTDNHYTNNQYQFVCAGTEEPTTVSSGIYWTIGIDKGVSVLEAVNDIIALAKSTPKEIVSIVFTFAEKPCTEGGGLTTSTYGTINPTYISEQLTSVLTNKDVASAIYTDITSDTTIDDVVKSGKNIIVKINHSNKTFYSPGAFTLPKGIMTSYASMTQSGYGLSNAPVVPLSEFSSMQEVSIYNGVDESTGGLTYYYHQAQKTEDSKTASGSSNPSIYDRLLAIDDIINTAEDIYKSSSHNSFFQIGIGGTDQAAVAKALTPYLYDKIVNKIETDPSPVGFVLMNFATSSEQYEFTDAANVKHKASSLDLVKAIIEMNNKFYLKRKEEGNLTPSGTSTLPGKNAAYAVVGEDAF